MCESGVEGLQIQRYQDGCVSGLRTNKKGQSG